MPRKSRRLNAADEEAEPDVDARVVALFSRIEERMEALQERMGAFEQLETRMAALDARLSAPAPAPEPAPAPAAAVSGLVPVGMERRLAQRVSEAEEAVKQRLAPLNGVPEEVQEIKGWLKGQMTLFKEHRNDTDQMLSRILVMVEELVADNEATELAVVAP